MCSACLSSGAEILKVSLSILLLIESTSRFASLGEQAIIPLFSTDLKLQKRGSSSWQTSPLRTITSFLLAPVIATLSLLQSWSVFLWPCSNGVEDDYIPFPALEGINGSYVKSPFDVKYVDHANPLCDEAVSYHICLQACEDVRTPSSSSRKQRLNKKHVGSNICDNARNWAGP